VHKHNILTVFYVEKETSAFPSLMTCMFSVFLAAFIMQVITAATLVLSKDKNFVFFGKICLIAAISLFLLACIWIRYVVKKGRGTAVDGQEAKYIRIQDEDLYRHPMDRDKSKEYFK
jgi:cbb3-type cytochrome oxidase subunit 3